MLEFRKILKTSREMSQQREFEEVGRAENLKQEKFDQSLSKGAANYFCSANPIPAY